MKLYYKAVTKEGKLIQGVIDAQGTHQAAEYLRSKEFLPISIYQKNKIKIFEGISLPFHKASTGDVMVFTRQLSSMLSAGLTLVRSLEVLKSQTKKGSVAEVLDSIIAGIEEGESFSAAIARYPNIFSSVYISVIKASESSGLLDKALLRFADNLEKEQKLKSTIKSALLYPAIVASGMIVVVAIMMIFVIPTLSELYDSIPNLELPLSTKIVVAISDFTVSFWPVVIGFVILFIFFYRSWRNTETGRVVIGNLSLRVPIFGPLIKKTMLTEFSRTFGLLVGTGTLVVDSINQVSEITGNIHFKNAILNVAKRVEKGESVAVALSHHEIFPSLLIHMVEVGEQTGKMDELLLKASEYFEGEVDQTAKTLTTALEPLIMVAIGIGVAFLLISVLTPIYSLIQSF